MHTILFLIIYVTGIVPAYILLKKEDMYLGFEWNARERLMCFFISLCSWVSVVVSLLIKPTKW